MAATSQVETDAPASRRAFTMTLPVPLPPAVTITHAADNPRELHPAPSFAWEAETVRALKPERIRGVCQKAA